ncbi:MAG: PEGA domain-containing protein [Deltaproteobacteria bacterium]|nr:PEGA domain-containing protein [Deltaproteobacteria bacterium]
MGPRASVVATVLLLSGIARADMSVAVVPLAADGELPASDRAAIDAAVAEELRTAGNRVLGPTEAAAALQARDAASWAGRSISGMSAVLVGLGWDTMVTGRVSVSQGVATLTLEAFETRRALPLLPAGETAFGTATGHDALVALARTATRSLREKLAETPRTSRLRVSTDPPRAHLVVNGVPRGESPWEGDLPPGRAVVRARRDGFMPATQEVILEPGASLDVPLRLVPRPDGAEAPGGHRSTASWQLPAGIAGLAAGAGLAVYGGYWLARSSCLERDPRGPCVTRLGDSDRLVFGALPLGGGVLVAAAGALVAFVFDLGPETGAPETE